MGVSLWEGSKADRVASALEVIAMNAAGGIVSDPSFDGIAQVVKSGMGKRAFPVGTQMPIEKETTVSATHTGSGITNVSVMAETFIAAAHESGSKAYEFTFDGAGWKDKDNNGIDLLEYGLTVTGTPAAGDIISVHETSKTIEMSVLDHDYDTPTNPNVLHTMTIGMNNCFENRQFDAPEALIYCPDGVPDNSKMYYIRCVNAGYGGHNQEDAEYSFHGDSNVGANVRYIRHSVIGSRSSSYSKQRVLAGNFLGYDAGFNLIMIAPTYERVDYGNGDSPSEVYLGTTTAENPSLIGGENVNFSSRNAYGSNDWETSNIRQYLNSSGTGWWKQQTKWDFPPENVSSLEGFLTGLDPALRSHMQTVKKRYARHQASGGGYVDTEDKVFLLGMTEVGFGKNNSIDESSLGLNNTIKTVPYSYFDGASNSDRIKLLNSSARYWWLRGCYPSFSGLVRSVDTDGSLYNVIASIAYGLVAACSIG